MRFLAFKALYDPFITLINVKMSTFVTYKFYEYDKKSFSNNFIVWNCMGTQGKHTTVTDICQPI